MSASSLQRGGISRVFLVLLCGFISCSTGTESAPPVVANTDLIQDGDDAQTIVTKAIQAHGGAERFTIWSRGYVKFTTNAEMPPFSLLGECVVEDTFDFPRRQKRVARGRVYGEDIKMTFVIDGPDVWVKYGDSPTNRMENYAPERSGHPFSDFCDLPGTFDAESKYSILGTEEIAGRQAIVIQVNRTDGIKVEAVIDKQSGLLVRTERRAALPDSPEESNLVTLLSDYRTVDGWRYPMRIQCFRDDKPVLDITIAELRFLKEVDDREFEKP